MRICHITTVHPPSDVRIFYRECGSLKEKGYDVHLVCPTDQSGVLNGIHIYAIKPTNRFFRIFFMTWVAMKKAISIKAVIYHYHDPELIFMGFILRWIYGKKVVYDIHESVCRQMLSKPYLPRLFRKPVSLCYKILERILTVGQSIIIANRNCVSDYSGNAYLVQNFPILDKELISTARNREQKSKVPLLVYVGRVAPVRGSLLYVELAKKLSDHGRDFHMMIIGQYTKDAGKELKIKIKELCMQDKITVTGQMEWRKAMELVSRATIGMCLLSPIPNYVTCLATKIIEYMMVGTPVLASDFDVWRPYVECERTGMMADPTNLNEIVTVCEEMLDNPDELVMMGKRGMMAVRSKYNWNSESGELFRCYEKLFKD